MENTFPPILPDVPKNEERAKHPQECARRIQELLDFAGSGPQKYQWGDSAWESLVEAQGIFNNDTEAALGIG